MKYYYREHVLGYQQVKDEGKTAWAEIHDLEGFENFSSRDFLEEALPMLKFSSPKPEVLEYGCGTGPGACFLAERGFNVDASDLIPVAIEIAKEQASLRNLTINFDVMDICELPHTGKQYDMIVDSYCLQGIVTDEDRKKVFTAVLNRLKPEGYYLISSAIIDESQCRLDEYIIDSDTGIKYNVHQEDCLIDLRTNIVYRQFDINLDDEKDSIRINNGQYIPVRRHLTPQALRAEIEAAGFNVLHQDEKLGEGFICKAR